MEVSKPEPVTVTEVPGGPLEGLRVIAAAAVTVMGVMVSSRDTTSKRVAISLMAGFIFFIVLCSVFKVIFYGYNV